MTRRSRTVVAALLAALSLTVLSSTGVLPAGAASQQVGGVSDDRPLGTAERVLVFTVPTLAWKDLDEFEAPNLERVLGDSVVGDLSVRSVTRRTSAADGYATMNAGTRTEGARFANLAFVAGLARSGAEDRDGDPVDVPSGAFDPEPPTEDLPADVVPAPVDEPIDPSTLPPEAGENYDGSPAAEEYARRSGVMPGVGNVFNFGFVPMLQLNDRLLFGSEVGALGDALDAGGVQRAVIANGDHGEDADDTNFRREASIGLMDGDGLVGRGRVGRTLLEGDSGAPFGVRYDIDEVTRAFEEFWRPRSVVLVEASDLVRAEDASELMLERQRIRMRRQAVERSDDLFGRLLEHVDLERDAVIVVAPYATGESTALTVVGVHSPATEAGLLSSGTTRRTGFVQTVDVAPTVLSLVDLDAPSSMEGTLMERGGKGGSFEERRELLVGSDRAAKFRDGLLNAASVLFVVAQVVLWALAVWTLSRGGARMRTAVEITTLAVLTFLPTTFLAGAFPFDEWGSAAYWSFVIGTSGVSATLIHLATRRRTVDPLIVTLALLVGFLSIDIVLGGPLQFNTVFGYTPTVAGRFNGMGNPAFSMMAAAGIMLAALVAHRLGGRRGILAAALVLAWCVVLDGAPFLGADVGGALALAPSAAVTVWMLLGLRIRVRTALAWAAATIAIVLGFGFLDLQRAPAKRTHLGRLLADIGDNGFEALQTVMLRKLNANLSVVMSSVWTLMVPIVFASVGFVLWWAPWRMRTVSRHIPAERAAVGGLLTAMLLGFALNDSGISVPGMMIGVVNAALVHLLLRVDALPDVATGSVAESDEQVAEPDDQLVGAQSRRSYSTSPSPTPGTAS